MCPQKRSASGCESDGRHTQPWESRWDKRNMECACVVCLRCTFDLGHGNWVVFLLLASGRGTKDQQSWGLAFRHGVIDTLPCSTLLLVL